MTTIVTPFLSTREAAQQLGCSIPALRGAIGTGKLEPPGKTATGEYAWLPDDLVRARAALSTDLRRHRQPQPQLPPQETTEPPREEPTMTSEARKAKLDALWAEVLGKYPSPPDE